MIRKLDFGGDKGEAEPEQLFLLCQSYLRMFWSGEDWVADQSAALHFRTLEQALTAADNQRPVAVILLVKFPHTNRHLIIPLEPQQSFGA